MTPERATRAVYRAGRRGPAHHNDGHGFTLIELMVCVAVLAVLATLAGPSFDSYLQRRRVEGLSMQLLSDWQFARTSVLARSAPLRLSVYAPGSGPGGCYLLHSGAADACSCNGEIATCAAGTEVLRQEALPASSRVRLSANVGSMLLDPRLGTVTPGGSIEITGANGDALKHVVSILGRVRVCASAGRWAGIAAC
ncbi:MAG: GspH/FimT family pseudopilin [Burkholderiales bacterium]